MFVGCWWKAVTNLLSHGTWFLLQTFLWEVCFHLNSKEKKAILYLCLTKIHTIMLFKGLKNWRAGHFQFLMLSILCFILHITRYAVLVMLLKFSIPSHCKCVEKNVVIDSIFLELLLQLVQKSFARLYFNDFLRNSRFVSDFAMLMAAWMPY